LSSISLTVLKAQTITATGINPSVGEDYVRVLTPSFSEGSSGTGQTWDISSITGSNSGATVVAVASTPNGANHPLANIAYDDGTNFSYFKTSSSVFQFHGIEGSVSMIYSNPEDLLRFPFSYSDSYSDSWTATFTSGLDFYRSGETTVTADGTGSLITPNGTISNVLRIHSVQVYTDSADLGGAPYIINYTNDQYFWYKDGNHFPLASTYTLTSSVSGPTTGGFYTDLNVGIKENSLLSKSLKLSPNPATDFVQISVDMEKNDKVVISIINMIGEEVYYKEYLSGNQSFNINTKNLDKGVYFVRVGVNGGFASKKLIVQ
tara:strand:- start:2064 stop:3020 length:957 start_codon:yes stop_codon:yes gene_type:complete